MSSAVGAVHPVQAALSTQAEELVGDGEGTFGTGEDTLAFDSGGEGATLQMDVDVILELDTGLWAGGFVDEEGEFATSFAAIVQEHTTGAPNTGLVGDGVPPEFPFSKEATMGETHTEGSIDVEYRPLEAEDAVFSSGSGNSAFSRVDCEGKTNWIPSSEFARKAISLRKRSSIIAMRSSFSCSLLSMRSSVGMVNVPASTFASAMLPRPSGSSFTALTSAEG